MISTLFDGVFYYPLYNALILLSSLVPGGDLGVAVVLLTLIVRFALAPLSHKAIHTQKKLKQIEPDLAKIKEKHKNNVEEQGRATIALYREHGINPFSGIALLFVQLPLFIALYLVARDNFANVAEYAYSFVTAPTEFNSMFLGVVDISKPSIFLAVFAGITYFVQAQLSVPPVPKIEKGKETTFKDEFMQGMSLQTRYILPIIITFAGFKLAATVLLYWITSNLFSICHELYVRQKAKALQTTV